MLENSPVSRWILSLCLLNGWKFRLSWWILWDWWALWLGIGILHINIATCQTFTNTLQNTMLSLNDRPPDTILHEHGCQFNVWTNVAVETEYDYKRVGVEPNMQRCKKIKWQYKSQKNNAVGFKIRLYIFKVGKQWTFQTSELFHMRQRFSSSALLTWDW